MASMQTKNNFGFIRLAAATLVIAGHSVALTGRQPLTWFETDIAPFALRIFFIISGYLICESWNRDPSLYRYLAKRVLRIVPGLFAVVVLTALVVGPLFTTLTLSQYLGYPSFRLYFWNLLLAPFFALPGVFQGNLLQAVNGSIWSIPIEFLMYVLLPLYGGRHIAACRTVLLPLALVGSNAAALYYTVADATAVDPVVYWTSIPSVLRFAPYFVWGAAISAWRLERWLSLPIAVVMIGAIALLAPIPVAREFALLVLTPYIVLAFALSQAPGLSRVGRRADASYGMYLYAFPIQQMLLALAGPLSPMVLLALATPVSYGCGLLSWHLVEHPALRLKPGRRTRPSQPGAGRPVATGEA